MTVFWLLCNKQNKNWQGSISLLAQQSQQSLRLGRVTEASRRCPPNHSTVLWEADGRQLSVHCAPCTGPWVCSAAADLYQEAAVEEIFHSNSIAQVWVWPSVHRVYSRGESAKICLRDLWRSCRRKKIHFKLLDTSECVQLQNQCHVCSMRFTFGFADDPFDKPPCRGCSSYLTEPYVKCAECGPPPFLLCLQVSARIKAKTFISLRKSSKACPVPGCSVSTLITGLCKLVSTHLFAQGQGNDKENMGGWRTEAWAARGDVCGGSQSYLNTRSQPDCNRACCCMSREVLLLTFFMA